MTENQNPTMEDVNQDKNAQMDELREQIVEAEQNPGEVVVEEETIITIPENGETESINPQNNQSAKTGKLLMWVLIIAILILAGSWGWTVYKSTEANKPLPTPTPVVELVETPTPSATPSMEATAGIGLANPASENCLSLNGASNIVKKPNGAEYGVCVFMDNRQCEEWALMRGECPVGGVKITGYETPEQIYCAITGGEVNTSVNTCTRLGSTCALDVYYNDNCSL